MPLTRLDTFLIRLLYAMAALIVVFQVLNRDAVVSLLFYASFVVVLALWLSAAFRKMALLDALVLTTIALALIHVLINAIATDASLSFQYLKKYIIFAFTLLMFSAADKLRVDADTGRWISRVMALSSAVLVAMYFWKGRELYEIHGRISNYLTFHFTNPNLTGLFLFCLAVYQFADALYGRDRKLQIVHGVLFAFLAYFIWKTQSRNALLVLIAFLVLAVVLFLRKKQTVAVGKGFCALMAVWPLLFAWLYMQLYGSSVVGRVLGFAVSEGKLLNSRTKMWNFAMQRYRTSPIVGAYNQITEGTGAGQMHNTHVDILAAYGPVVLVLVCVILYLLMRRSATNATHHPLYVVGFMCTIVMGMGEAAMFTGQSGPVHFCGGLSAAVKYAGRACPASGGNVVNLVFVSNFYNHHQASLCNALWQGAEAFHFVQTAPMDPERQRLGWDMASFPPYVTADASVLDQADVVACRLCAGGADSARRPGRKAGAALFGAPAEKRGGAAEIPASAGAVASPESDGQARVSPVRQRLCGGGLCRIRPVSRPQLPLGLFSGVPAL